MKKLIGIPLLVILFIIATLDAYTEDVNVSILPSLDWQRQHLEDKIVSKLEKFLDSLIASGQYNIDVQILTSSVITPKFNESLDKEADKEKADGTEIKNPLDKEENLKSKASIKFSDALPVTPPEDFIVFNKFGLEAPLVDDFNDFQPDGKIIFSMNKDKSSFDADGSDEYDQMEDSNENLPAKDSVSPVEQVWKYNQAVDIFKNLQGVNIIIRISESIDEQLKKTIEKDVKDINFNLGEIKPSINFEYSVLKNDVSTRGFWDVVSSIMNFFSKFATLLGIILGVLLLGFIGKQLISKYFELNQGQSSSSQTISESGKDEDDKNPDNSGVGASDAAGEAAFAGGINGVDRFKTYINSNFNEALLLVKKWVTEDDPRSKKALSAIVQQMNNEDLAKIFIKLSEEERNTWKTIIEKPLDIEELKTASNYISSQIVQNIILPGFIDDPETYDLILKLRPELVVTMIKDDLEISSYLLNALSLNFVNQILALCDDNTRDQVINRAVSVTSKEVLDNQDKIKRFVSQYVEINQLLPFVERAIQLIPMLRPESEDKIYQVIAQKVNRRVVVDLACEHLPFALVKSLPRQLLRDILTNYPLKRKVKMLLSITEELRNVFMEISAPEGTKVNYLINLEFDRTKRDQNEYDKIIADSSDNIRDFILYVRKSIKQDKNYTYEIKAIVSKWAETLVTVSEPPRLSIVDRDVA